MSEMVPRREAVDAALQAVMVVDAAYGQVLLLVGIPKHEVTEIQQAVRDLIADALDA